MSLGVGVRREEAFEMDCRSMSRFTAGADGSSATAMVLGPGSQCLSYNEERSMLGKNDSSLPAGGVFSQSVLGVLDMWPREECQTGAVG